MSHCPHCQADLQGVEHLTACPACGRSLPPKSQRGAFVSEAAQKSRELLETPVSLESVDPLAPIKATLSAIALRAAEATPAAREWTGVPLAGPRRVAFLGGAAAECSSYEDAKLSHLAFPRDSGCDVTMSAKKFPTFGSSDLLLPDAAAPGAPPPEPPADEPPANKTSDPFAKTIDSDNFPPVPATTPAETPLPPKTVPDRFAGTIDSDSFPPVPGGDSSEFASDQGTVPDPRYAHTVDSDNFDAVDSEPAKTGTWPGRVWRKLWRRANMCRSPKQTWQRCGAARTAPTPDPA